MGSSKVPGPVSAQYVGTRAAPKVQFISAAM